MCSSENELIPDARQVDLEEMIMKNEEQFVMVRLPLSGEQISAADVIAKEIAENNAENEWRFARHHYAACDDLVRAIGTPVTGGNLDSSRNPLRNSTHRCAPRRPGMIPHLSMYQVCGRGIPMGTGHFLIMFGKHGLNTCNIPMHILPSGMLRLLGLKKSCHFLLNMKN